MIYLNLKPTSVVCNSQQLHLSPSSQVRVIGLHNCILLNDDAYTTGSKKVNTRAWKEDDLNDFSAPELIRDGYGSPADMFSLGALLYYMVTSRYVNTKKNISFDGKTWSHIRPEFQVSRISDI